MKATSAVLALALGGCAFFGKQPPLQPRYYDPEPALATAQPAGQSATSLRLGHVFGGSHLRERIAYHVSEHELGFYDERRWTERPENYLRRALARELFERRGAQQIVSGVAPTLEVELTDFSELKQPQQAVRARARVLLVDAKAVRFERTFNVELATRDDDFDSVPQKLGEALSQLVTQIADRVLSELGQVGEAGVAPPPAQAD